MPGLILQALGACRVQNAGKESMTHYRRTALGVAFLVSSLLATATLAEVPAGWTEADMSAAKVRELQTSLMVAALRCRAGGMDIVDSYNDFIAAARPQISAANAQLKAHFMAAGPIDGQRDYDRYTTALANYYGADETTPQRCDEAASMAREAAAAGGNLPLLAARAIPIAAFASATDEAEDLIPDPKYGHAVEWRDNRLGDRYASWNRNYDRDGGGPVYDDGWGRSSESDRGYYREDDRTDYGDHDRYASRDDTDYDRGRGAYSDDRDARSNDLDVSEDVHEIGDDRY